jgi:hypothetical protein
MILRPLLFVIALLIAGCVPASVQVKAVGNGEAHQVSDMLAWSQRVSQSPPDEQRRELAAAGQAFGRERNPRARLRLALLLAYPGGAVSDDTRAMNVLEPFANITPESGPLAQLGGLLYVQVGERIREQRRAQQMKEQLDALRAMERNLLDREQSRNR